MAVTQCCSNCTATLQIKVLHNMDFQTLDTSAFQTQCGRCTSLTKSYDHIQSLCRVTCDSDVTSELLFWVHEIRSATSTGMNVGEERSEDRGE